MNIRVKETTKEDLTHIVDLWNNGEVMFYVGFPEGLGITLEQMERWYEATSKSAYYQHYSIYTDELGYCGESCYDVDPTHGLASMDIKLLPKAQGKGIAAAALAHALSEVFNKDLAECAYVEPCTANEKAWKLYEKLGFVSKERPDFLEPEETYLEVDKMRWVNK